MAFRRGGNYGLQKALESGNTCTAVYSSGLQVSGTLKSFIPDVYIQFTGPTALALDHQQLPGHGKTYHRDGYGSPIGSYEASDLLEIGLFVQLNFERGQRCF